MENNQRFHEIDLLRFFAAFSVMLYHYSFYHNLNDLDHFQFQKISEITKYGYLGVDLFFIISGFVIFFSAQAANPINFVVSRIVRLFPAYWFCLSLTLIATIIFHVSNLGIREILINLTMLQGFLNVPNIDSSYWTLGVEICFYTLIFILISLNHLKNARYFFVIWLVLTLVLKLYPIKYVHIIMIPDYSAYFISGAVFYLARQNGFCLHKIGILLLCYIFSIQHGIETAISLQHETHTYFSQFIVAFIITSFYLIFALISSNKIQLSNRKIYLLLGGLTYPLYLIHQKFGCLLMQNFKGTLNQYFLLSMIIILMLLVSLFVNQVLEKKTAPRFKNILNRLINHVKRIIFSWHPRPFLNKDNV